MFRFTITIAFAFLTVLATALPAIAGLPRIRPAASSLPLAEDKVYTHFQAAFFSTSTEFSASGDSRDLFSGKNTADGKFDETTISIHYETSMSDFWTLVVWLGYQKFSTEYTDLDVRPNDPARLRSISTDAFSELWISGRMGLTQTNTILGNFASGLQAGVKLPTGDVTISIPTGSGALDYEVFLLPELRFHMLDSPATLSGAFGYRLRGGGFGDEMPYLVAFNMQVAKELVLRATLNGISADPNGETNVVGISYDEDYRASARDASISVVGDESYTQFSVGFEFIFSRVFSVSFDYMSRISGTATMSGDTYLLGFTLQ